MRFFSSFSRVFEMETSNLESWYYQVKVDGDKAIFKSSNHKIYRVESPRELGKVRENWVRNPKLLEFGMDRKIKLHLSFSFK